MALSEREREIVKTLTETKAVDFDAIGRTLAQFGPTAALDLDYEPYFVGPCGTTFISTSFRRPSARLN
jgi:hypothetical protein